MTKWETIYIGVLTSMVEGNYKDIEATWMNRGLDTHASALSSIAAGIADRAVKDMKLLQPLED